MKNPIISVDRRSKSYAIFDGIELVRGFDPFLCEKVAIREAINYIVAKTGLTPKVVFLASK